EAITTNDPKALRSAAHTMRSSSGNLGAVTMGNICHQLENLGRADTTIGAAEIFPTLENEYEEFKRYLINFKSRNNIDLPTAEVTSVTEDISANTFSNSVETSEVTSVTENISADTFSNSINHSVETSEVTSVTENISADTFSNSINHIQHSVLDLTVLDSIRQSSGTNANDVIAKMIEDYLKNVAHYMEQILNAIAINSTKKLKQYTQLLGVYSSNIGAINIPILCDKLANLPGSELITEGMDLVLELDSEYEKVIIALKQELLSYVNS
ncbi:Hpt domain-containing protein, partial [Okeania sp. SIO2B9]